MKQVKYKNFIFMNGYVPVLSKLADQPIGARKGWELAKYIKQVSEKNKIFEEQRIKLLDKFGKKGKDGNYKIDKDKEGDLNKEFDVLLNIEETYDVEPITLDDDVKMSAKDLLLLDEILIHE